VTDPIADLLGESGCIAELRNQVRRLLARWTGSRRPPPLLLRGETGTGKGLLASTIHRASARAGGPLVAVNCAAVPPTLLEAEFFGVEKGAFTDARESKAGLFEAAHRGTLFLDEVGLLPESLQAKLLTVLDDWTVRRVGSTRGQTVDIGLTAATSMDLEAAVQEGRFRQDLFHRLSVVTLRVPPLRERGSDVLLLAAAFLSQAAAEYNLPPKTLSADARDALLAHHWPGNVRELANVLERAVLLSEGATISVKDLGLECGRSSAATSHGSPPRSAHPFEAEASAGQAGQPAEGGPSDGEPVGIRHSLEAFEREQILDALTRTGWNVAHAAEVLGIPRNTLRYRIAKYRLQPTGEGNGQRPAARAATKQIDSASPPEAAAIPDPAGSAILDTWPPQWETRIVFLRAEVARPAAEDASWTVRGGLDGLADKVRAFGGLITAQSETRLDAAFGVEPAEDAPSRAANSALAIQKAVERMQATHPGLAMTLALHARPCAVHASGGTAMVGDEDLRDVAAALTALIQRGEAGTVLVSAAAAPLLQRRFVLEAWPSGSAGRDV
jgi:two-component system, NtrC family, response regulator AtoC